MIGRLQPRCARLAFAIAMVSVFLALGPGRATLLKARGLRQFEQSRPCGSVPPAPHAERPVDANTGLPAHRPQERPFFPMSLFGSFGDLRLNGAEVRSTLPTVTTGENAHDYFAELAGREDALCVYSLRDQTQLDQYVNGQPPSDSVTYDTGNDTYRAPQDAAKIFLPENTKSIHAVKLPLNVVSGTVLVTWDAWWGREFIDEPIPFVDERGGNRPGMTTHKTFTIRSNNKKWLEIRTHYGAEPPYVGGVDLRPYSALGPNTRTGPGDRIEPKVGSFLIAAETWTRYWLEVDVRSNGFERVSLWVGDETRAAVQLYDRIEMELDPGTIRFDGALGDFWLEYNSSAPRRGPSLTAYVRNLVALRDAGDPSAFFQRPL